MVESARRYQGCSTLSLYASHAHLPQKKVSTSGEFRSQNIAALTAGVSGTKQAIVKPKCVCAIFFLRSPVP